MTDLRQQGRGTVSRQPADEAGTASASNATPRHRGTELLCLFCVRRCGNDRPESLRALVVMTNVRTMLTTPVLPVIFHDITW